MIADLRRSAESTEVLLGLVITFNVAVLAVLSDWTFVGIIVGGIVGLALVYLMIRWAWLIPVIIVVGFALQPALKFYLSQGFGPAKDAGVVVAVAALLASFLRRRWRLVAEEPRPPVDRPLVFAAIAFIALYLVNPAGDHGTPWAIGSRLVVEAFALFLVGYLGPTPARTWRYTVAAVLVTGIVETLAGIAEQYVGVTKLVQNFGYVYGEQVRQVSGGALRSFGTLDDPFAYAALVLLAFIVATQARLPRAVKFPLAALIAAGVVVSFDRTDIVLLILAGALWMVRNRLNRPAIAVLGATALIGAAFIGTNDLQKPSAVSGTSATSTVLSLNGRLDEWATVLADPGNLLGGSGVGVTGAGAVRGSTDIVPITRFGKPAPVPRVASNVLQSVDSSYLATLADVGLVGLLLLLFIAARMIIVSARAARLGSSAGWVALGVAGLLLLDATTRSSLTAFPFGFIGLYVLGASLAAAQGETVAQQLRARHRRPGPESATPSAPLLEPST